MSSPAPRYRLGVDVGGTHTDLVLLDTTSGALLVEKVASTPKNPALGVLDGVDELYVAKGKKVEHVDLKRAKPDRATLLGLLLGPTGNLRAPTLRKGRTLIVGFEEETYKKLLS